MEKSINPLSECGENKHVCRLSAPQKLFTDVLGQALATRWIERSKTFVAINNHTSEEHDHEIYRTSQGVHGTPLNAEPRRADDPQNVSEVVSYE